MDKNEQDEQEIMVRLILKRKDDKRLFDSFSKIKRYMGSKLNTEVARFCIRRTYDLLKKEGKVE